MYAMLLNYGDGHGVTAELRQDLEQGLVVHATIDGWLKRLFG